MFKRANIIKFVKNNKKQIMFALFALYCIFDKSEVYKSVAPVVVVEGVKAAKAAKAAKVAKEAKDFQAAKNAVNAAKNVDNAKNAVNAAKEANDAKNAVTSAVNNAGANVGKLNNDVISQNLERLKRNSGEGIRSNTSSNNSLNFNKPKNTNPNENSISHQGFSNEEEEPKRRGLGGIFNDLTSGLRGNRNNKDDEVESEPTLLGDTNVIKNVNPIVKIGCVLLIPLVFIMSIPMIIVGGGLSTKSVMEYVDCDSSDTGGCEEEEETGSFIKKFLNFFKYGSFGTNSEVIADKVTDTYDRILAEYEVSINKPLLISSLIIDLDNNDNGKDFVVTDEMMKRLKYIYELGLMQIVFDDNVYLCQSTEVDGRIKYYETPYYGDTSTITISSGKCNAFNVGNYIAKIEAMYSEEEYYNHLKESVLLEELYSTDQYDADTIIDKIKTKYQLYKVLYVGDEEEGEIPSYLMSDSEVNLTMPLKGSISITSPFGERTGEFAGFHNGIDLVSNDKTIYAAGNGVVTRANHESTGGNVIEITHTDSSGNKYISLYAHIKDDGFLVSVGNTVQAGDPIAIMGATGQASGVHLHFSFWDASTDRDYMNPRNLFNI